MCVCECVCVWGCVCPAHAVRSFLQKESGQGREAGKGFSGCRGVMDKRETAVCRALSTAGELRASTGVLGRSRWP